MVTLMLLARSADRLDPNWTPIWVVLMALVVVAVLYYWRRR